MSLVKNSKSDFSCTIFSWFTVSVFFLLLVVKLTSKLKIDRLMSIFGWLLLLPAVIVHHCVASYITI